MLVDAASSLLLRIDRLLRGEPADAAPDPRATPPRTMDLIWMNLLFGMLYGAVMGSFGGFGHGRWWQVINSALKVPMLLWVGFGVSVPSFFVLNTVLGVRSDLADAWRAILSAQAGFAIVLASLAPLTAFWYVSDGDYDTALVFNAAAFGVAAVAAQAVLRRSYRPLVARNPRHRLLRRVWGVTYAFATVQMAWVLRPFVGSPTAPVTFFRPEAWGNAYVELIHIILRAIGW